MPLQAKKEKKPTLTIEEKLENALIADWEQPYSLPENWVWTRLGSILTIRRGASPRPIKSYITRSSSGVNWIKIGDTSQNNKYITNIKEKITPEGAKKSVYVEKGSLLLSNSMSFGRPYILSVDGCIHDGWLALTPFKLSKDFLYYALLESNWYFNAVATGSTVLNLNSGKVSTTPLPLPPLAEQERIVTRIESLFAKLDEAKELAESALEKYENRKSAILHQAFTGELTANWRKENNVSMDTWEEIELGETLEATQNVKLQGDNFTYIDIDAINNKLQKITNPKLLPVAEAPSRAKQELKIDDILFSLVRPYLKNIAYVTEEYSTAIASTGFYVCRPNSKILPYYVYYLLCFNKNVNYLNSFMKGDNSPSINRRHLLGMLINLPTLPEQKEIVRIIDSLFEKEYKAKECYAIIAQIELMKKAILGRAFRGELGTNIPEEESAKNLLKEVLESKEQEIVPKKEKKTQIKIPKEVKILFKTSLEEKIYKVILEKKKCSIDDLINITKDSISVLQSLDRLEQEKIIKKQDDYYMI